MRIAIVRLSALGDIINSAFILPFLHEKHPDAQIDWICEEVFSPILLNNPYLHAVHTVNLKKDRSFSGIKNTIKKLKALGPYDKVIDLQGLIKSSLVAKYLGKQRYGFNKHSIREPLAAWFYQHHTDIAYSENSIWRTATLINDVFDTNITQESLSALKPSLFYKKSEHISKVLQDKNNIAFIVGSSQAYKNYPIHQVIKVITQLPAHVILVWGSNKEYQDAKIIHEACSNTTLCEKLSLPQLIDLIDCCDLTIGNDTGPTHIAWALGKKSITMFGATSASKMMWQSEKNIAIESDSFKNILKINKEDFSIADISPDTIVQAAKGLLDV